MKDIKVIIAAHKNYQMPEDEMYVPLHVGAEGKFDEDGNPLELGYIKDNTGDNISEKNSEFCELTGLYWAWKNLKAEYIGLAHYRRHFVMKRKGDKWDKVANKKFIDYEFEKHGADVILPKPRNYFIETNYSQYVHAHHAEDLDTTKAIIEELYPEYLDSWNAVMESTKGHRFNMFIMKYDLFCNYMEWLFGILFELEKRLDISDYTDNDKRVFGFVAERLLDVWIDTNMIDYLELPVEFMENENWIKKGSKFLKRKFLGKNEKNVSHVE